jgi:voltage-gated potassium channel
MLPILIYPRLRKFFIAAFLSVLSLLIGVWGFSWIEGYDFLDSLYMTIITISTVGYREVQPLSEGGKLFVVIYIMMNIGIFTYVVSIITTYVFEGELNKIYRHIMFGQQVRKMKNHVIVCGYGRNGSRACEELRQNGTPLVIIEKDPHQLTSIEGFTVIQGDATLDETLKSAGIERAQALISTLPHDADNVFIAMSARDLNRGINIIARATDHHSEQKLLRAGADAVVMPDILGGMHMANMITKPYVIEFLEILNGMGNTDLKLEEYGYELLKSQYQNRTLEELSIKQKTGATVIGVKDNRRGFLFGPPKDTVIGPKDVLIVLGAEDSLARMKEYLN